MGTFRQDLRYGFRMLLKRPAYTALAILTLALGIGANSAIFSVVYTALLRPLPYPDANSIVLLAGLDKSARFSALSPLDFQDFTEQAGVFKHTAALTDETFNITGASTPERISGASVTCRFFNVFDSKPIAGRTFLSEQCKETSEKVVVISNSLWKGRFSGKADIVGTQIQLDGFPYTIIGVAGEEFDYPKDTQVWRQLIFSPSEVEPRQRGARWLTAVGRLKDGISLEQADAQMKAVAKRLSRLYPRTHQHQGAVAVRLQDHLVRSIKSPLLILLGAVALVLLIACANVANLLLAQATSRQSEVAIRSALGAGRIRLIKQFIIESMLLTMLAGAAGILLAFWIRELLLTLAPIALPANVDASLDITVFIFGFGCAAATGFFVGLVPALHAVQNISETLKNTARSISTSGKATRRVLVSAEIALALMLLAGAGLLIRSFAELQRVNPGFQSSNVLTFYISLPASKYPENHQIANFYQTMLNNFRNKPGVVNAGAIFGLPMTDMLGAASSFEIKGITLQSADEPEAMMRMATPGYFETLQIPLKEGRWFQESDGLENNGVAIVNESAARKYWPGKSPIGQTIRLHASLIGGTEAPRTVVGVAGDVRHEDLASDATPEIYIPHQQHPVSVMTVTMRTEQDPASIISTLRNEVASLDPELPLWQIQTMDEIVSQSVAQRKFTMLLLAAFALLAILLGAIGIYGVLSYTVTQRIREIGLRMAMGAQQRDVLRLFLREGVSLAFFGVVAGLFGAFALTRLLSSLLYQVGATDPLTFASVIFVLTIVAAASSYIPARRATRVDPMTALRYE